MYRDDLCAVCGESLPPDHLYCREHAAVVDDLLHELGKLLPRLMSDLDRAAELLDAIHPDTWDYLAEKTDGDLDWPPHPRFATSTDGEDVDVDVDSEPGQVMVTITGDMGRMMADLAAALRRAGTESMAAAARMADGAGATH